MNAMQSSWKALGALVAILSNLFVGTGYGESWSERFSPSSSPAPSRVINRDAKTGALSVLLIVGDEPVVFSSIRDGLAQLPEIVLVDTFNSRTGTPGLDQLLNYSCVIVWANYQHLDPITLGDNLADYADNGGAVIASAPSRIYGTYYIGGRFLYGGYDPLFSGAGRVPPSSLGDFEADHPTMNSPYEVRNLYGDFRERTSIREGVEDIARWADAAPLLAVKGQVAADTAFLNDGSWTGDFAQLLTNTCIYLGGSGAMKRRMDSP